MSSMVSSDQHALGQALCGLGDPRDDGFELRVREFIDEHGPSVHALEALFDDGEVGLASFCVAMATAWRDQDFQVFRDLLTTHRIRFGDQPVFDSYDAQSTLGTRDISELRRGLEAARSATRRLRTRPGLLHTFAAIAVELAEMEAATEEELREAEGALRTASRQHPTYAKYFATRARILSHQGKYAEAYRNVATAIELEPSNGRHYALRIGEYQATRMDIAFRENAKKIDARVAESSRAFQALQEEMASTRGQLIEILGLLAAVIAFVVTGAQVSVKAEAVDAVPIIGAVGGAIVLAFSSLSLLYGSLTRRRAAGWLMGASVAFLLSLWLAARWAA